MYYFAKNRWSEYILAFLLSAMSIDLHRAKAPGDKIGKPGKHIADKKGLENLEIRVNYLKSSRII